MKNRRDFVRSVLGSAFASPFINQIQIGLVSANPNATNCIDILDGTGLSDMPRATRELGFDKIPILYEFVFRTSNQSINDFLTNGPSSSHIKSVAKQYRSTPELIINVERWKIHGSWARAYSAKKNRKAMSFYERLLGSWKESNDHTRIGLYGLSSSQVDAMRFASAGNTSAYYDFEETKKSFTKYCDFQYPSGYWRDNNASLFEMAVKLQVSAAKNVHQQPVRFFTWHRGAGPLHQYQWLPPKVYRYTLDLTAKHGDGIIAWAMSDERTQNKFEPKIPAPYPGYKQPKNGFSTNAMLRMIKDNSTADKVPFEIQWYFELLDVLRINRLNFSNSANPIL